MVDFVLTMNRGEAYIPRIGLSFEMNRLYKTLNGTGEVLMRTILTGNGGVGRYISLLSRTGLLRMSFHKRMPTVAMYTGSHSAIRRTAFLLLPVIVLLAQVHDLIRRKNWNGKNTILSWWSILIILSISTSTKWKWEVTVPRGFRYWIITRLSLRNIVCSLPFKYNLGNKQN